MLAPALVPAFVTESLLLGVACTSVIAAHHVLAWNVVKLVPMTGGDTGLKRRLAWVAIGVLAFLLAIRLSD
jgi:hypothetical protein